MIEPDTASLVERLTKIQGLARLFDSSETEWRAVADMQNTLPPGQCERFMVKVLERCGSAGNATVEDRVHCYIAVMRGE